MRKVLVLAGLLMVIALASTGGGATSVLAATMCSTSCSGSVTLCCTPTTSCTSVPGSTITCDSVVTSCGTANAWCACTTQCDNNYYSCSLGCDPTVPATCRICDRVYERCLTNCGPQPANVCSC